MQTALGISGIALILSVGSLYYSRRKFYGEIAPELIVTNFDPLGEKLSIRNVGRGLAQNIEPSEHVVLSGILDKVLEWKLRFQNLPFLAPGESADLRFDVYENGEKANAGADMAASLSFPYREAKPLYLVYEDKLGLKYYTKVYVGPVPSSLSHKPRTEFLHVVKTGARQYIWVSAWRSLNEMVMSWKVRRDLRKEMAKEMRNQGATKNSRV